MSAASVNNVWLAPNPRSSYRQLFVKGTRISARVLYGWNVCEEPRSAEEIAADYGLPVQAVEEAIAYCKSNPPELQQDYAREEALMEAAGINEPDYKYHARPKPLSAQERAKLMRR